MNLKEKIRDKQVVLIVVPKKRYKECVQDVLKAIDDASPKLCYAHLNKSHDTAVEDLKRCKADIERYFFIDILSKGQSKPAIEFDPTRESIQNEEAIQQLGLAFNKMTREKGCGAVLFDPISSLTCSHDEGEVLKLINSLINRTRMNNLKTIYLAIQEESPPLINDISMFADSVIDLSLHVKKVHGKHRAGSAV